MEYKSARTLASMIQRASGLSVRVDELYARRRTTVHRAAILSQFTKVELVEILKKALDNSDFARQESPIVEDFINNTVEEPLENEFIIS